MVVLHGLIKLRQHTRCCGLPKLCTLWDLNIGVTMGDPNGGYFEIYTTVMAVQPDTRTNGKYSC
ncbi:MAG: hypothetical protein IPP29_13420 [Bacteroidetes bacterium]|nr:hypothetical protein [Bacteroidota bacterium]